MHNRKLALMLLAVPLLTLDAGANTPQSLLLARINRARAESGLAPIQECQSLHRAAQKHSDEMEKREELDHSGLDGSSSWDRMCREGYELGCGPRAWVGEIIAMGNSSVEKTFQQWWQSEGHQEIMMSRLSRFGGVGYAPRGNYWTVDFAAKPHSSCNASL